MDEENQGVIIEPGRLFREEIDRDLISKMSQIQSLREDADYEPYFEIEQKRAEEVIETANNFIQEITNQLEEVKN